MHERLDNPRIAASTAEACSGTRDLFGRLKPHLQLGNLQYGAQSILVLLDKVGKTMVFGTKQVGSSGA